jgi:hypothetical protein
MQGPQASKQHLKTGAPVDCPGNRDWLAPLANRTLSTSGQEITELEKGHSLGCMTPVVGAMMLERLLC